ncbi:MAG: GMC family oxidoreductase N-terminal domain-containing protein [Deltaproteobacteria bacterium]|nr:GMC family oxidoreductase N-terminal domain-containing protein [Deltaproteobacteria bacterium]
MLVRFRERMRGRLTGPSFEAPVELEVEAQGGPAWPFLARGRTRIVGTISIPPLVIDAPLSGKLDVSLVPDRTIDYDIDFAGTDGVDYKLVGQKLVTLTHPIEGMTKMAGRLLRGSELIASGDVVFSLGDLPEFLASWSLAPEGEMTRTLGDSHLRTLIALAEALIPQGENVPAPDGRTFLSLERFLSSFPLPLALAHSAGLATLETLSFARTGSRFSKLTREGRQKFLEDLLARADDGPIELAPARLVHLLASSVKLVHFARGEYAEAIGHPEREVVAAEPRPRYFDQVLDAAHIEGSTLDAEVVVVGTGAGGAAIAKELSERGVAVLMIEEGAYQTRKDFAGPPVDRMRRVWRDRGLTFTIGEPAIIIPLGRTVGGTTAINSGTCFRAPDQVLLDWVQKKGFPEEFLPESFARHYEKVEGELEVALGTAELCGAIGEVVAAGASALGLEHGPLPRNAPACDARAECILGCPTGAKRSTDVSYVPRALRAGAQLITNLTAERLVTKGRRVVGIDARSGDRRFLIRADAFVISMGSLLTPTFLMRQGFTLPRLGRNLSVHPALGLVAELERDMQPWHAVPQGYGFSGFENEGICFEGFYLPPALFPPMLPLVGRELTWWMDRFRRLGQFGFMVKDQGVGRVTRGPDGRPLVFYSAATETVRRLRKGIAILAEVLIRGGARQVLTGALGVPPVTSVAAARALESRNIRAAQLAALGAHPLGTCAVGRSREDGVVDFEHRVFGTENLYVMDGSTVPTSLGVNPQMTIMAMATRAAEILASGVR